MRNSPVPFYAESSSNQVNEGLDNEYGQNYLDSAFWRHEPCRPALKRIALFSLDYRQLIMWRGLGTRLLYGQIVEHFHYHRAAQEEPSAEEKGLLTQSAGTCC